MKQETLDFNPHVGPQFKGETYEPKLDQARLGRQLASVMAYMADGEWHTLREIAMDCRAPEASVSARLRDMRRPIHKGGQGLEVQRRRDARMIGLHEYRSPKEERWQPGS